MVGDDRSGMGKLADGQRSVKYRTVRNATTLLLVLLALGAFLQIWKAEVTGFQIFEPRGEDAYCSSYGSIGFLMDDNIVMDPGESYQLEMSCLHGGLEFQENSEYVDIDSDGRVHLMQDVRLPEVIPVFIIAEHESGLHKAKKFIIEVER